MNKYLIIFLLVLISGFIILGLEDLSSEDSAESNNGDSVEDQDGRFENKPDTDKDTAIDIPHEEPVKEKDTADLPRVSIIIDDLGNNLTTDRSIKDIDADLTLAILPFRNNTLEAARSLSGQQELILHLPLEPMSDKDIEEQMLTVDMTLEEQSTFLTASLEELGPYVKGVNNHKGSRFTSDREAMRTLLQLVQEKDRFFVDSFTIGDSQVASLAREMGIKTAVRDVFLDNSRDPEDIRARLLEVVQLAEENGEAIAIGHSTPETITVLREELPELKERVNFVPVSEILK